MEVIRAAEAVISLKKNVITKVRVKKGYRNNILDDTLRRSRTAIEYNLLLKAVRYGINAPMPIEKTEYEIFMQYISGELLRNVLDDMQKEKLEGVCKQLGEQLALLHKADIIHGDLTTSNLILSEDKIYFIDFGLGYNSQRVEDKANDLHLLKKALDSKHSKIAKYIFEKIKKSYAKNYELGNNVLKRLEVVENRRRYLG